jgi:hypothetical protein
MVISVILIMLFINDTIIYLQAIHDCHLIFETDWQLIKIYKYTGSGTVSVGA